MNHRRGRFTAVLLAAIAVALPPLAGAQSAPSGSLRLNFAPPKGWTDTTRPNDRPGVWKDWMVRDGGAVHSIVLSVTRESRPAAEYGPANVEALKGITGVTMMESGPATTCGDVPAFTYTYRSDRTPGHPMIIRHLLVDVGSLLGDVSYARPPDAADRADARDAMNMLCDQQTYAPRAPVAWRYGRITSVAPNALEIFTAPTGGASLMALAIAGPPSGPRTLPVAQLGPGAAVLSDAEETCGTTLVRRTRYRTGSGAAVKLDEVVSGYRHGMRYVYTYSRPEATPLDPDAELALTSFCDAAATLATPPPAPTQPKPPA